MTTAYEYRGQPFWEDKIALAKEALKDATPTETSSVSPRYLARTFDHTLLKPDATADQVKKLCEEALRYDFASVCIREPFVAQAATILQDDHVDVCCVVGFHDPTASSLEEKVEEGHAAVKAGASELDMVINWGLLKHKQYDEAFEDMRILRGEFPKGKMVLKVILETSQLTEDDIISGCVLADEANFDFVKTSTGFLGHGAKVGHVQLMRQMCDIGAHQLAVKASGGIRTLEDAKKMIDAGAGRLGASASVAIMDEALATKK